MQLETMEADPTPLRGEAPLDTPLFENIFPRPARRWRTFLGSLCGHFAFAAALPWLGSAIPSSRDELPIRLMKYESLQLRMPEQMALAKSGTSKPEEKAPDPPKQKPKLEKPKELAKAKAPDSPKPDAPRPELEEPPAPVRKPRFVRRFELPESVRQVASPQTVIQPDLPPDLPLPSQKPLPNIVLWGAARVKRPIKQFVVPGSPGKPAPPPTIQPPPSFQVPNTELNAGSIAIASAMSVANPKLPVQPGRTTPIRRFVPPSSGPQRQEAMNLDAFAGEPANLIAYNPNPAPMPEHLIVAAGNQIGRIPPPPSTETGRGKGTGVGKPGGTGSGGTGASNGPGGTGNANGAGSSGVGAGGSGTGTGRANLEGSGDQAGEGTGASGRGSGSGGSGNMELAGGRALSGALGPPVRVEHPVNGVFDVVIVSSNPLEGVVQTSGVLSGSPIYTVYVRTGSPKEWVLQYCVPGDGPQTRLDGAVVLLGNPAPLRAPYPLVTEVPPAESYPASSYVAVYGFVSREGRFTDLRVLGPDRSGFGVKLLKYLDRWHFRPATRDGVPVQVEVVLAVPPTGERNN